MAKAAISVYLRDAIEGGFNFIQRRFETLEEMVESFRRQRAWIYERLQRKADYKRRLARLLEVIKMHSCKHLGISYLSENNMIEAFEALHRERISKRTVHTLVAHLRELGFVSAIPTKRGDGKQSANILVLERMEESFAPQELAHKSGENLHTKKALSSSKPVAKATRERIASTRSENEQQESIQTKGKNKSKGPASSKRLLNLVPEWFRERIACCAREAKAVHEYWKVAKHLTRKVSCIGADGEGEKLVVETAVREFFKASKAATKGRFVMANPYGFFHSVLEAETTAHIRRRAQEESPVFYDWLAES